MHNNELTCLQIISDVGNARSKYIEAIQEAKAAHYERCNQLMREGNEAFAKGHRAHAALITQEAGGKHVEINVLLIHAEDQLMSAESFKILCSEFLDVYRKFDVLQDQVATLIHENIKKM